MAHDKKSEPSDKYQKIAVKFTNIMPTQLIFSRLKKLVYFGLLALLSQAQVTLALDDGNRYQYIVLGDSMVKTGFGQALRTRFSKELNARVKIFGKSSSGLSRPDVFDWNKALEQQLKPPTSDASAYVMIGTNDCQDLSVDGTSIPFASSDWIEIYKERLEKFAQSLCKNVKTVYWLGLPPMKPKKFNEKISQLNRITEEYFKSHHCVRYIATQQVLGTKEGSYQSTLQVKNSTRTIRDKDGIHISSQGAQVLVDFIIREKFF